MAEVVWKRFRFDELFEFSAGNTFSLKDYNLTEEKNENSVEVVTSSKDNINNYIDRNDIPEGFPIYSKSLTINRNGSIGYCFYHSDEFIIPTGDSYALLHKNEKFKNVLTDECYSFLSIIITSIFTRSLYGYSYKVNSDRFDRELFLLPCLETNSKEEAIWEEDGKYYTLAVNYIKKLMDKAKELREEKTIRLYEAQRAKYEAQYIVEKKNVVWKRFRLGELFERSTELALSVNQKDLNLNETKDEQHQIALISASRNESGRVGYVENDKVPSVIVSKNKITFDDQWGYSYFQQEDFVITGGHNAILEIKNDILKSVLDENIFIYSFLSLIINKITVKSEIYGYGYKINNKFDRELLLLPCLETNSKEEAIWEENGKYYTLAVNYISYLYLTGKVKQNQKLIDNYTYQY